MSPACFGLDVFRHWDLEYAPDYVEGKAPCRRVCMVMLEQYPGIWNMLLLLVYFPSSHGGDGWRMKPC